MTIRTLFEGLLSAALLAAFVGAAPALAGEPTDPNCLFPPPPPTCGDTDRIQGDTFHRVARFLRETHGVACRIGCTSAVSTCIALTVNALSCENQEILGEAAEDRAFCFEELEGKDRADCILEAVLDALDRLNRGSSFTDVIGFCRSFLSVDGGPDGLSCRDCSSSSNGPAP